MKDRRRFPRKAIHLSVFTEAHLEGSIREQVLTDISAWGLQFLSESQLSKGQHLNVQLQKRIQNGTYEIRSILLSGRVVWTRSVNNSDPQVFLTGVEFDFRWSGMEQFVATAEEQA